MRKMLPAAAAAFLAVVLAGLAQAQTPAGVPAPGTAGQDGSLQATDTDRDGSISLVEAGVNPALAAQFVILDRNGNGALEPAEFAQFQATTGSALDTTPGTPGVPAGMPPPIGGTPPPITTTPPPLGATPPPLATPPPAGTPPPTQQPPPR